MSAPDTTPETVAERVAKWRQGANAIAVSVNMEPGVFALVKANATIDELNLSAALRAACDLIEALTTERDEAMAAAVDALIHTCNSFAFGDAAEDDVDAARARVLSLHAVFVDAERKARRELQIRRSQDRRLPLCADCRDKQPEGRACLACEAQRLTRELAAALARAEAAERERDNTRAQAESWAMEARTQRATVRECYQAVTGATGEPGDWHGAQPIRDALAAADAAGYARAIREMSTNVHLGQFGDLAPTDTGGAS